MRCSNHDTALLAGEALLLSLPPEDEPDNPLLGVAAIISRRGVSPDSPMPKPADGSCLGLGKEPRLRDRIAEEGGSLLIITESAGESREVGMLARARSATPTFLMRGGTTLKAATLSVLPGGSDTAGFFPLVDGVGGKADFLLPRSPVWLLTFLISGWTTSMGGAEGSKVVVSVLIFTPFSRPWVWSWSSWGGALDTLVASGLFLEVTTLEPRLPKGTDFGRWTSSTSFSLAGKVGVAYKLMATPSEDWAESDGCSVVSSCTSLELVWAVINSPIESVSSSPLAFAALIALPIFKTMPTGTREVDTGPLLLLPSGLA